MNIKQLQKNQVIIEDGKKAIFFSYNTLIATINKNGFLHLTKYYNYSKTTTKYLYQFIDDYTCKMNEQTKTHILYLKHAKNKKEYLQQLIDKKIVILGA